MDRRAAAIADLEAPPRPRLRRPRAAGARADPRQRRPGARRRATTSGWSSSATGCSACWRRRDAAGARSRGAKAALSQAPARAGQPRGLRRGRAARIGIGPAPAPGRRRDAGAAAREHDRILADACEALIGGALPRRRSRRGARRVFARLWARLLDSAVDDERRRNPKTALQEWAAAAGPAAAGLSRWSRAAGPTMRRLFTVEVAVDGPAPARATAPARARRPRRPRPLALLEREGA